MKTFHIGLALCLLSAVALAADVVGIQKSKQIGADSATAEQVSANNTAQGGANVGGSFVLPAIVQSSLPTYSTNGNLVGLTVDASGRLYVTIDSTSTSGVNLKQVNGAALSASNPVFTQLSDGAATYTGAKTGQLPSSLGQTTMSGSVSVAIASNQSTLNTTTAAPTGSNFNKAAVVNIAAAGTSAIVCKSGLAVSQPTKPLQYVITAPGSVRCQLRFNDNSTITNFTDVVTAPGSSTVIWSPPTGIVGLTTSSTVTTLQYEANCTNFDAVAQDVGCTVVYCQAASGC